MKKQTILQEFINHNKACYEESYGESFTKGEGDEYECKVIQFNSKKQDREYEFFIRFQTETFNARNDGIAIMKAMALCSLYYAEVCDFGEQFEDECVETDNVENWNEWMKCFIAKEMNDFHTDFCENNCIVEYVYNKTKKEFIYQNNTIEIATY